MTNSRHTTLSVRTHMVSLMAALRGADARDYFSNDRTTHQIGVLKGQLEKDGLKDIAQHASVALRIAEILQGQESISREQALEIQRMIAEAIANSLSIDLSAHEEGSAPVQAKTEALHRTAQLKMVSNRKLGEILVQMSLLTTAQVEQALAHQRMTGCRLGEALVQMRVLPKATIESALRVQGARRQTGDDPWRAVS